MKPSTHISNLLALEQRTRSRVCRWVRRCVRQCDFSDNSGTNARADWKDSLRWNRGCKQLLVGLVCCVCIYGRNGLSELYAKYFLPMSFRFGIYRRSSLEGQGPPNAYIEGAIAPHAPPPPPPPPHCSAAPALYTQDHDRLVGGWGGGLEFTASASLKELSTFYVKTGNSSMVINTS